MKRIVDENQKSTLGRRVSLTKMDVTKYNPKLYSNGKSRRQTKRLSEKLSLTQATDTKCLQRKDELPS